MASAGSLRIELELADGSFTTRIIRAGTRLRELKEIGGQTIVSMRRLDSAFAGVGNAVRDTVVTLGLARAAVENLYTVFGSWAVSIAQVSGEMQRMNTLLRGMANGITDVEQAAEASKSVRYLQDLARVAPFALRDVTQAFVRMRAGGIEDTERAVTSLTDAVAAFGGSREQLDRASVAIQQMAGKGVISMEELRQQLGEAVPSALPLMARALGTSVDDLVKRISDGRVRAAPALQALTAEFERTFGGRAAAMMQTFNGQVQQVQNNWMRLQTFAGGLDQGGNAREGGFLATVTAGLTELNAALSSPEGQGAAIRFGQILTQITTGLISVAKWAKDNAGALLTLGAALVGLLVATTVVSAVQALAVSLNFLYASALVPATTAVMTMATRALPALGAALIAVGGGVNIAVAGMTALTAAIARLSVAGAGLALTTGLMNAGLVLGTFQVIAARTFASFMAWLTAGTLATYGLRLALSLLAVGGVGLLVVGGLTLIGNAVDWLSRKYTQLTRDSGAAYDRIRAGATDESTVNAAIAEADKLAEAVATARDQIRQLEEFKAGLSGNSLDLARISGEGVIESAPRAQLSRNSRDPAMRQLEAAFIESIMADRLKIIEASLLREQTARDLAAGATAARQEQVANAVATLASQRATAATLLMRSQYAAQNREIEKERVAIDAALAAGAISRDQRQEQIAAVDGRRLALVLGLYDQQQGVFSAALETAYAAQVAAIAKGDQAALLASEATIKRLETDLENITKMRREAEVQAAGPAGNGSFMEGGQSPETIFRVAETMANNLRARIAEVSAESRGLGGELEKVNARLTAMGETHVGAVMVANLRQLAAEFERVELARKRFRDAQAGQASIETGLDRAQRDLQSYLAAIDNPNLPEAQRRFVTFQREMAASLEAVRLATGGVGAAFQRAAQQAGEAVDVARAGAVINQIEDLVRQGEAARISALPATQRAAEQTAQLRARVTALRAATQDLTLTEGQRAEALAKLNTAEGLVAASFQARQDRAATSGGAPVENTLTRLTARLEEMRAETVDGTGELERYTIQLTRAGTISSAAGQAILIAATAIDAETDILKRATDARSAFTASEQAMRESVSRTAEYQARLGNPNEGEANRRVVAFTARQREMVAIAIQSRDLIAAANAQDARLPGANAAIVRAEAQAARAIQARAGELSAENAVKMQTAERQVREGLAQTSAERRRLGGVNLDIEASQARALIAAGGAVGLALQQQEDAVSAYILARRENLNRQTEGALAQQMRTWGNVTDNMSQGYASALDGMSTALTNFVTTGKADMSSLAKSIIADLVKIQLQAAASKIFEMFSGGIGGVSGKGGGFGGKGSMFDTGGAVGGAKAFHTGGIAGMSGGAAVRAPGALWHNAPRFHAGTMLRDNEVPAILERGEAVFTSGQLGAIGRMNHSYTQVEALMAKMSAALSAPASAVPAGPAPRQAGSDPGRPAMAGGNVSINLINQSGNQLSAEASQPRFDGEGMIIDVVVSAMQRPGRMRDAMRGAA